MPLYWIKKNGNFGKDISFGMELPKLPEEREKQLIAQGFASREKPANFDAAKESILKQLQDENKTLISEVASLKQKVESLTAENEKFSAGIIGADDLKKKLEDLEPENVELKKQVEELTAELEDVPKNVREANKKIKALQAELDELTEPKGKGGKNG